MCEKVGAVTNTFGVPGVEENCFFLKKMEEANELRKRINECFEIASLPNTSPEERKRLLTFVIVRTSCRAFKACSLRPFKDIPTPIDLCHCKDLLQGIQNLFSPPIQRDSNKTNMQQHLQSTLGTGFW